jgi:hypothetical protein
VPAKNKVRVGFDMDSSLLVLRAQNQKVSMQKNVDDFPAREEEAQNIFSTL